MLLGHVHELAGCVGIFNVTTHFVSLCITKIVISGDDSATAFGCYFLPQAVAGGVIPKFQISFEWTVYGKMKKITRNSGSSMEKSDKPTPLRRTEIDPLGKG
jgi:hypothetical protein